MARERARELAEIESGGACAPEMQQSASLSLSLEMASFIDEYRCSPHIVLRAEMHSRCKWIVRPLAPLARLCVQTILLSACRTAERSVCVYSGRVSSTCLSCRRRTILVGPEWCEAAFSFFYYSDRLVCAGVRRQTLASEAKGGRELSLFIYSTYSVFTVY